VLWCEGAWRGFRSAHHNLNPLLDALEQPQRLRRELLGGPRRAARFGHVLQLHAAAGKSNPHTHTLKKSEREEARERGSEREESEQAAVAVDPMKVNCV
jgi:hypothetical protein